MKKRKNNLKKQKMNLKEKEILSITILCFVLFLFLFTYSNFSVNKINPTGNQINNLNQNKIKNINQNKIIAKVFSIIFFASFIFGILNLKKIENSKNI